MALALMGVHAQNNLPALAGKSLSVGNEMILKCFKLIRLIGLITIIIGLLLNAFILAKLFYSDGSLVLGTRIKILIFQCIILS